MDMLTFRALRKSSDRVNAQERFLLANLMAATAQGTEKTIKTLFKELKKGFEQEGQNDEAAFKSRFGKGF